MAMVVVVPVMAIVVAGHAQVVAITADLGAIVRPFAAVAARLGTVAVHAIIADFGPVAAHFGPVTLHLGALVRHGGAVMVKLRGLRLGHAGNDHRGGNGGQQELTHLSSPSRTAPWGRPLVPLSPNAAEPFRYPAFSFTTGLSRGCDINRTKSQHGCANPLPVIAISLPHPCTRAIEA